jgi:hypothetical protein
VDLPSSTEPQVKKRKAGRDEPLVRRDQAAKPLVLKQTTDESDRDRLSRRGQRRERIGLNARARDQEDFFRCNPDSLDRSAIVIVLHQNRMVATVDQGTDEALDHRADQTGFELLRGKNETQTGERVEADERKTDGREFTDDRRLQGDVVNDGWRQLALQPAHVADNGKNRQRGGAAALSVQRMQMKIIRRDGGTARDDMGRDMHVISRPLGRQRHRQAMREEIPILGDEI